MSAMSAMSAMRMKARFMCGLLPPNDSFAAVAAW
jgi:hypothetical protein